MNTQQEGRKSPEEKIIELRFPRDGISVVSSQGRKQTHLHPSHREQDVKTGDFTFPGHQEVLRRGKCGPTHEKSGFSGTWGGTLAPAYSGWKKSGTY
ncbi:hypothetical protein STEG23_033948, partial [Scotinomys teguina]